MRRPISAAAAAIAIRQGWVPKAQGSRRTHRLKPRQVRQLQRLDQRVTRLLWALPLLSQTPERGRH
jgi:hypothetical protein